jgi:hypothetical protein
MHSFKDFLTVDYMPGSDELMKYQAQKRKRGAHDSSGTVSEEDIDEVLGVSARIKKKAQLRKNKAKIKLGQRKSKKKIANVDRLKKRARRQARMNILKKLLRGKSKSDLSYAARASYEKRVNRRKVAINRMAKKLLPTKRAADRAKMRAK